MRKKLLSAIIAAAMTFSFAACTSDSGTNDTPAGDAGNNAGTTANAGNNDAGNSGGDSGASASGEVIALRVWGGEEDQTLLT